MIRVKLIEAPFAAELEASEFAAQRDGETGALATFVGYCRSSSETGAVSQLDLDHYPGFTESEINRLAQQTARRHGLDALLVIHRVGAIAPGEAIVLVAALSAHRAAAFTAVAELMDYLKTDAPLWKRESGSGGSRWIEPTAKDRARRRAHGDDA